MRHGPVLLGLIAVRSGRVRRANAALHRSQYRRRPRRRRRHQPPVRSSALRLRSAVHRARAQVSADAGKTPRRPDRDVCAAPGAPTLLAAKRWPLSPATRWKSEAFSSRDLMIILLPARRRPKLPTQSKRPPTDLRAKARATAAGIEAPFRRSSIVGRVEKLPGSEKSMRYSATPSPSLTHLPLAGPGVAGIVGLPENVGLL